MSRFCKPARCGAKERRRVVKFTVQAAWIIVVAVLAIRLYALTSRPRFGACNLVGRMTISGSLLGQEDGITVWLDGELVKLRGEKGGSGGLSREVRDLDTRSWAARGEAPRTRQITRVGGEDELRS